MKLIATADLHGVLPEIESCDLLLICGDVCPTWNHERKFQASWLRGDFTDWLNKVPAKHVVGIGGNHDFVLEGHKQKLGYTLPWNYLNNESVEIAIGCLDPEVCGFPGGRCVEPSRCDAPKNTLKIWGSPLSPTFGHWANTKPEPALRDVWDTIPKDVDIIMTHGPAYGIHDKLNDGWSGYVTTHLGSTTLANRLAYQTWPNLKLHVCGHIHEGYGDTTINNIRYVNASQMNEEYVPKNPPVVINL